MKPIIFLLMILSIIICSCNFSNENAPSRIISNGSALHDKTIIIKGCINFYGVGGGSGVLNGEQMISDRCSDNLFFERDIKEKSIYILDENDSIIGCYQPPFSDKDLTCRGNLELGKKYEIKGILKELSDGTFGIRVTQVE